MSVNNGQAKASEVLTVEEKLDTILEGLAELSERFDELVERINNMSREGADYGIDYLEED